MSKEWAYAVTTVRSREDSGMLNSTLKSLADAGFPCPHLFMDGAGELVQPIKHDRVCTARGGSNTGAFGNWLLTLAELWVRYPKAERYAVFQDDLVVADGLKEYLDWCEFPAKGYWNLYTFRDNERLIHTTPPGWHEAVYIGKDEQGGKGGLGLVFDNAGAFTLLTSEAIWRKPHDVNNPKHRYNLDGAVVAVMNRNGFKEYVHNPSLLQHVGYPSTIRGVNHRQAKSWRDGFDARSLIKPIP